MTGKPGWVAAAVASIAAVFGLAACGKSAVPTEAAEEANTPLGFVRITASEADLDRLQKAAASAGWTEAQRDESGALLLKAPADYNPDRFGALLEAISPLGISEMGLQLLLPDGRVVGGDGRVVDGK